MSYYLRKSKFINLAFLIYYISLIAALSLKMKFAKTRDETGKRIDDKTTIIYNHGITIENIPLEAYDYIVNGKPALE